MDAPYATIADLRAEGVDETVLDDRRAMDLLLLASRQIDQLTGQWFSPRPETLRLNGDDFSAIRHPTQIPILAVHRLAINRQPVDPSGYVHQERCLELVHGVFPTGVGNVELEGVFGWLEARPPAMTQLQLTLAHGQTEARLIDASGFHDGDFLLVNNRLGVIAQEISGQVVSLDPVRGGEVMSSPVVTYGRVPRPIERACVLLVLRNRHGMATDAGAQLAREARMVEERTDGYRYKLAAPAEPLGTTVSGVVTSGDAEVDRLLVDFVSPPYLGVV